MNRVGKFAAALLACLGLAMTSFASFAASEFEGTWVVKNGEVDLSGNAEPVTS